MEALSGSSIRKPTASGPRTLGSLQPLQLVSFLLAHRDSFHPSALRLSRGTFYLAQLGTFHLAATPDGTAHQDLGVCDMLSPIQAKMEILVQMEIRFNGVLSFLPMSSVRSGNRVRGFNANRWFFAAAVFGVVLLLLCVQRMWAQGLQPSTRWNAQYTPIYFDTFENLAPALGPAFILEAAGSFTSNPSEVIAGTGSIKGSYSGTNTFTGYLQTSSSVLPFAASHAYQVKFQYKILTAATNGFPVGFHSVAGGSAANSIAGIATTVTGPAGATGTATVNAMLGAYTDYYFFWGINGTGAISIDNIQVIDGATGKVIASEDAEGTAVGPGPGLILNPAGSITTDPALVIGGKASVRLTGSATLSTKPAVLQLAPNTTYIVEFQYHLLNYGTADDPVRVTFQSAGQPTLSGASLLKTAPVAGTFSSGAQTAGAASYTLNISVNSEADIVLDNLTLFRQDAVQTSVQPGSKLPALPDPRLGGLFNLGTPYGFVRNSGLLADGLSVDEIEGRLAFWDVIAALSPNAQTSSPDSIRRLRQLNPNAVILPLRDAQDQQQGLTANNMAPDYQFLQGIADAWYLRDSAGNYVIESNVTFLEMNISPYCPVVNGQTYFSYLLQWLSQTIFPSGIWDGVYFDSLLAAASFYIPNVRDPARFDVDYSGIGMRDTIAWVNDMNKDATSGMLEQFRTMAGDAQLVVGNSGPTVTLDLAPYVNGYKFECMNAVWNDGIFRGSPSPINHQVGWRSQFDAYRQMEANELPPRINIIQGCSGEVPGVPPNFTATPTFVVGALQNHRLTMGTALLGDGFYSYDAGGGSGNGTPQWLDEYSVDSAGNAVEDRTKKGYLGQALSVATELTSPGILQVEETFDGGPRLPASFTANNGTSGSVYVTTIPGEVIQGTGSLVIDNPDHTQAGTVSAIYAPKIPLTGADQWLLTFDWHILETLDGNTDSPTFQVYLIDGWGGDFYAAPGVVKGDSGTAHLPIAAPQTSQPSEIIFEVTRGGGKVAIDNIRIYQGGVGPWRRDFENGFVLVNPLAQPHTFSASDLAGVLNRTGIHRISGTQAPDINNGQPVTDSLTLGPFDAIILLADRMRSRVPRWPERSPALHRRARDRTIHR